MLSSYNPLGKTLSVLEYSVRQDEPVTIGLELVQKKGEINIAKTCTHTKPQEVASTIKTIGVNLVITNDQVLYKKVVNTGTDAEIVAEAFPNLSLNDFYYQILRSSEKSFITICRKEYVEHCIEEFREAGVKIKAVNLGVLAMIALSEYAEGEQLNCHTAEVYFENKEIVSISSRNEDTITEYDIEGLTFSSTYALSLATALNEVMQSDKITGNINDKNKELQTEFKETGFFKNTLQFGIGFLLITLLINFFVFNSNYKKWQGLQEELQVYTVQKEQIANKQSELNTKEALVQSILATGFSKSSWFVNTMVQAQPSTIVLTSLVYQPLKKPVRKSKRILLEEGTISISGTSTDKSDFTIWLRTIEGLEFVETVTITHYGLNKKHTTDFELTIRIKTDNESS